MAKSRVEQKIRDGDAEPRKLGWFRVDIEAYPDMAIKDDGKPDQMIVGKEAGLLRFLHHQLIEESSNVRSTETDQIEQIANVVVDLTGEWYLE